MTTFVMGRFCKLRAWVVFCLLFLLATTACSRSNFHRSDAGDAKDPNLPFHQDADAKPAQQTPPDHSNAGSGLPFDNSSTRSVPAGTLLTVRLEDTLSTAKPAATNDFAAILDTPVRVAGNTVLPQGTVLHGKVESARASQIRRDSGYVRLTLKSLVLDGKEVPVQTSSLFATGKASSAPDSDTVDDSQENGGPHPRTIQLTKGRRLTFRLTAAAVLKPASARSAANLPPTTE